MFAVKNTGTLNLQMCPVLRYFMRYTEIIVVIKDLIIVTSRL